MIAVHVYASLALLVLAAWTLWYLVKAVEAFQELSYLNRTRDARERAFLRPVLLESFSGSSRDDAGGRSQSPVVALKPPLPSFVASGHGDAPRSTRADGVAVLHDRWVAEYAGEPLPPTADRLVWEDVR